MTGINIAKFFFSFIAVCAVFVAVNWLCELFLRWQRREQRRISNSELNAHRITVDIRKAKL